MQNNNVRDFLGNPLNIGDRVVALGYNKTSSALYLAEIIGFKPTYAVVKILPQSDTPYFLRGSLHKEIMVSGYKLIKLNSENLKYFNEGN